MAVSLHLKPLRTHKLPEGYYVSYKQDSSNLDAIWSHCPQDPNQSKSNKSKEVPIEGVTFLSHVTCSGML